MKRSKNALGFLLALCMLAGCLTLAGCGKKTITFEEIEKATQTDNLLKTYTSFQYSVHFAENDYSAKQYVNQDMIYVMYPDFDELYIDGKLRYVSVDDTLACALFVHQEPIKHPSKDNILFSVNTEETMKSCKTKDGKIYMSTEFTTAGTEENVIADGYEYHEGEYMVIDYVLDEKTSVILSGAVSLIAKDGTKRDYLTITIDYNVERPESAQTIYEHATATSNLRTFTIITDPDTSSEQSFAVSFPKGDAVQPYPTDEYTTLFSDRACTEECTSLDRNADCTVYMKNGK